MYHLATLLPTRAQFLLGCIRSTGVARWHIFKPNWVNLEWSCNGRWWYILCPFGQCSAISYILWPVVIFYGYLLIFSRFGMLYHEKSGNPALHTAGSSLTWEQRWQNVFFPTEFKSRRGARNVSSKMGTEACNSFNPIVSFRTDELAGNSVIILKLLRQEMLLYFQIR
jgi:hypothetical protein